MTETNKTPAASTAKDAVDPAQHGHDAPLNAKAFAPNNPVDVPNLPKSVQGSSSALQEPSAERDGGARTADVTKAETKAATKAAPEVDPTTHSWADSTQPAPDKKNARSSIL